MKDLSERFMVVLQKAITNEFTKRTIPVLIGMTESGVAVPWKQRYVTFGNGHVLPEGSQPVYCGTDLENPEEVLMDAQAKAIVRYLEMSGADALVFRTKAICTLERVPASYQSLVVVNFAPTYRPAGFYLRSRVAFVGGVKDDA